MRYLSLQLKGYIRLVNGIGTPDIFIDFRKQKYRTCIIRGENGSGKSTIFNALSVLPDSNDNFIPGKPAMKEIYLQDDKTIYIITCIHGVKNNGDRDTTKVYFKKQFPDGSIVELNENGNVNSYKDLLFEELKLDSNFIALSQLSMDDKGLATKKPAERKRFVNAIISSLEIYNNIYKQLNKTSSVYKSMVNSVVSKLGQLGDENLLNSNYLALTSALTQQTDKKEQLLQKLGEYKSQVAIIDGDGSLQQKLSSEQDSLNKLVDESKKTERALDYIYKKNSIDISINIAEEIELNRQTLNKVNVENEILKTEISGFVKQREEISKEILDKKELLLSNSIDESPETIQEQIDSYLEKMKFIIDSFYAMGISDISNISKDEYIMALETIRNIQENIEAVKSDADMEVFLAAVDITTSGSPYESDINNKKLTVDSIKSKLDLEEAYLVELMEKLKATKVLVMRPEDCKLDHCPFISDAVKYEAENISQQVSKQEVVVNDTKILLQQADGEYKFSLELNRVINSINNIIRNIKIHTPVLSKLPNGNIYTNPKELFTRYLKNNTAYEEMMSIYQYINLANNIDIYKNYSSIVQELNSKLELIKTKATMSESIQKELESLNSKISTIDSKIRVNNTKMASNNLIIMDLNNKYEIYIKINDLMIELAQYKEKIDTISENINTIKDKLKAVESSIIGINSIQEAITAYDNEIKNINNERDQVSYALKMIREYKKEYNDLSTNYEYIETIKYYASPTTGIQLIFMQMYMSKIISLANELLALLFNGRFVIKEFIINESEFRIPCLTDGYTIDDISSMSSAQVSMISMILSFSLLYHSSTKYNIIKLDEIDAPLDENNRLMFIDVLNQIMNIMQTEQCIMISHNSELQIDSSDVIILKNNNLSSDYNRGNIIWSYN